jgi:hypothetical protein
MTVNLALLATEGTADDLTPTVKRGDHEKRVREKYI